MEPIPQYEPELRKEWLISLLKVLADPQIDAETLDSACRSEAIPYVWRWQEDMEPNSPELVTSALKEATENVMGLLESIIERNHLPKVEVPQPKPPPEAIPERARLYLEKEKLLAAKPLLNSTSEQCVNDPHFEDEVFARHAVSAQPDLYWRSAFVGSQVRERAFADDHKVIEQRFRCLLPQDSSTCISALSFLFYAADGSGGAIFDLKKGLNFSRLGRIACSLLHAFETDVCFNAARVLAQVVGASEYFPPTSIPKLLASMATNVPCDNGSSVKANSYKLIDFLNGTCCRSTLVNMLDRGDLDDEEVPIDPSITSEALQNISLRDLSKLRLKLAFNDVSRRSSLVALQAYALSTLIVLLSDFGFDKVILSRCPNALNAIVDVCRSHSDVQVNSFIKTNIVESLTIFLSFVGVVSSQKYFKRLQLAPLLSDFYARKFDEKYFEQLCDLASFAPSQTGIHPLKLIQLSVDPALPSEAKMRALDVLLRTFDPPPYEDSVVSEQLLEPTYNALFDSFDQDLRSLLELQKRGPTLFGEDCKVTDTTSLIPQSFDPERLHQRVTERLDLLRIFLEPLTWENFEKTALKSRLISYLVFILSSSSTLESLPTRALNSAVEIIDILCRTRQARVLLMNEMRLKDQLFDAIVAMSRVTNRRLGLLGAIQVLHDCLWGHDVPSDRFDDEDDEDVVKPEQVDTNGPDEDEDGEEEYTKYGLSTRYYNPEVDGDGENSSEYPHTHSRTELIKSRNFGRADQLHMRMATDAIVASFCERMPTLLFDLDENSASRNFQKILAIIRTASAYHASCFYRWVLRILKSYVITRRNTQNSYGGIKELLTSASEKLYEGNAVSECLLRHYILSGNPLMLHFSLHSDKTPLKFDLDDIEKMAVETSFESNSPLPIWRMMEFLGLSNPESICTLPALQFLRNSLVEKLLQPEMNWSRDDFKAWHLLLEFSSNDELVPVVDRISHIMTGNDLSQLSKLARLVSELMDLGSNVKLISSVIQFVINVLKQVDGSEFAYLEPQDSPLAQLILKASQIEIAEPSIREQVALLRHLCLEKAGIAASRLLNSPLSSLLEDGSPMVHFYTAASAAVTSAENESQFYFLCSMICSTSSEQHLKKLVQCLEHALSETQLGNVAYNDKEARYLCIRMLARHLSLNPQLGSSRNYLNSLVQWSRMTLETISNQSLSLQALAALEELLKSIINVQSAVSVPHAGNSKRSSADVRNEHVMAAGGIVQSLPSTSVLGKFFMVSNEFFHSILRTHNSTDANNRTAEPFEETEYQLALQCFNSVTVMLVQSRWPLASLVIDCGIIETLLDFDPKLSSGILNELQKTLTNICHIITTSPRISARILIELLNSKANYRLPRALNSELDLNGIIIPAHALVLRKPELRGLANDCYFVSPDGKYVQRHIVEESALARGICLDIPDSFELTKYAELPRGKRTHLIVELIRNFLNAESPKQAEICALILIDQLEISGHAREAIMELYPEFVEKVLVQYGSQNVTEFTQKVVKPHAKNLTGLVVRLLDKFTCKSKDEPFSRKVSSSLKEATRFVMKGVLAILKNNGSNQATKCLEVTIATLHFCCDVVQSIWGDSDKLKSNLPFAKHDGHKHEVPELYFRKVIRDLKVIEALFGTFAMYNFGWHELRDLKMCSLIFLDRIIFQELFRIERSPIAIPNRSKKLRLESAGSSDFSSQTAAGNELDEIEVDDYETGDESEDLLHTDLVEERRSQHRQRIEASHGNIFRNSSLGEYESSSSESLASDDGVGFDEIEESDQTNMIDDNRTNDEPFRISLEEESSPENATSRSEPESDNNEGDEIQLEVMLVLSEDDFESMGSDDFSGSEDEHFQSEDENNENIMDANDDMRYGSGSGADDTDDASLDGHHEVHIGEENMPLSISRFGDDLFLLYNTLNDVDREHPAFDRGYEKIDYYRLAFEHPKPGNIHMNALQARAHAGFPLVEENGNDIWCCPSDQRDEPLNMAAVILDIVAGMKETANASKERYFEDDAAYTRVFENLSHSIGLRFIPKTEGSNQSLFIPQLLAMLARICFAENFDIELDLLTNSLMALAGIPSGRQLFSTLIHILFEASCGHIDTIYASLSRILASSSPFPMKTSLLATKPPEGTNAALVCRNVLCLLNIFFGAESIRDNRDTLHNKYNKELCEWEDRDDEIIKTISAMARSCVKKQGATILGLITRPVISQNKVLLEQASSFVEKIVSATNDSWNPSEPSEFSDPEDVDADSENRRGLGSKDLTLEVSTVTASRIIHVLSSGECNYRIFRNIVDVVKKNTAVANFSIPLLKSLRKSKYKLLASLKGLGDGMKESFAIADMRERFDLLHDVMRFLRLINVAGNLFREHECLNLFKKLDLIPLWRRTVQFMDSVQQNEGLTPEFTLSLLEIVTMPAEIILREHDSAKKSCEDSVEHEVEHQSTTESSTLEQRMFIEEVTQNLQTFLSKHSAAINELIRFKPKLLAGPLGSIALKFKAVDFENKFEWLSQEISHFRDFKYSKDQKTCVVSRENIFEDSLELLSNFEPHELLHPISIEFEGEPGIDDGGVSREWYEVLSREILNPMYGLFKAASPGSSVFQVDPLAEGNPDKEAVFKFVGRFLGRAVYDQYTVGLYFSRVVYKYFLGEPISLSDMEAVDEEYYKSLKWMLENDITDVFYETFCVEIDNFGAQKIVDLIPGGRDIAVDESNKEEYVRLIVEYKLVLSVKSCLDSMTQGLYEVLFKSWVQAFTAKELELVFCGLSTIDVDDWCRNTEYHGYTSRSRQVRWFWLAVRSFSPELRAKLLQFSTGTSRVPAQGFGNLDSNTDTGNFIIEREKGNSDRLPSAHTCMNQICIPEYESYSKLRKLLLRAITEGNEGFGFV